MARFEQISFTRRASGSAPERLPVQTCILAIASASLALWLVVGFVVRLSL
ncbi:MAG TPA: hypothetical protein VLV50_10000 [Stellaceae bacterium]|nr:hypothetical protein [Stellaceae bacterium]